MASPANSARERRVSTRVVGGGTGQTGLGFLVRDVDWTSRTLGLKTVAGIEAFADGASATKGMKWCAVCDQMKTRDMFAREWLKDENIHCRRCLLHEHERGELKYHENPTELCVLMMLKKRGNLVEPKSKEERTSMLKETTVIGHRKYFDVDWTPTAAVR